jgi:hypothetical protein
MLLNPSSTTPINTKFADSANLDAFGRVRVSEPFPIFDNKNTLGKNTNSWEEVTNGVGASITYIPNESSVRLETGTVSGEYAIRQTARYFPYVPGKSHNVVMTMVLGNGKENVVKRFGLFDDKNGVFFEQLGTEIRVVIRSNTSGTPVDSVVAQEEWAVDKLNGTGVSGITLDQSKFQIGSIDFQWLGGGRVRYGFNINGKLLYCHEANHANINTMVYMETPTLPLRYEIRNVGTSASSTSMDEVCCALTSEGGYVLPGLGFSASRGITIKAVTTRVPIFAIRLKNSFESKENRRTARFLAAKFFAQSNDVYFEIHHVHKPSAITATWNDVSEGSAIEYSTDISAVTGNPTHLVDQAFVPSGQGSSAVSKEVSSEFINQHSFLSQNFDSDNSQMFVIYATSFTGTANVSTGIT